jgi:hypothetical protein
LAQVAASLAVSATADDRRGHCAALTLAGTLR